MQLIHKEKYYIGDSLVPVGLSFCKDMFDKNVTIFNIHFVDEKGKDKKVQNINILEMYEDNEAISFNHILSEKQMHDLLDFVDDLIGNDNVDGIVFDAIIKLVLLMATEYKVEDKIDIKKYFNKNYKMNNNFFKEVLNGANQYIENNKLIDLDNDNNYEEIIPEEFDDLCDIETDELEKTAVNLNLNDYEYDPAIGRNEEIKDMLVSLMQGSCILVGEPGVGKTALAEGVAYRIKNGNVPDALKDKEVYKISATDIVKGCKYVGEMEEKMADIISEILYRENVILFFDEMHTAIGTGKGGNGTLDISNILKPYIDKGQIKMIGATTTEEYDEYIGSDPAFRRRFEKIKIKEPSNDSLYEIINYTIGNLEKATNVKFDEAKINKKVLIDVLIEATSKSHRNYQDVEYNPGLVLSIIKKAFSYAMYYEHKSLLLSDVKEAYEKCEYIYKPVTDKIESAKSISKQNNKTKRKVIEFVRK